MREKFLGNEHIKYSVGKSAIFILGIICEDTPKLLKKALNAILKNYKGRKRKKKVSIYIQSEGGLFYSAVKAHAILSVYKKAKICTVAVGHADSCAIIILQGGDRRFAFSDATLGIHMTEYAMPPKPVNANFLNRCLFECISRDTAFKLILMERGEPEEEINKLFEKGTNLTAQEAKRLNLIDKVLDPKILKPR